MSAAGGIYLYITMSWPAFVKSVGRLLSSAAEIPYFRGDNRRRWETQDMAKAMQIEFVSDVVCPWCVIGLRELERALGRLEGVVAPTIELQPFELNPAMAPEGQDLNEHITQKYGERSKEQMAATRSALRS